MKLRSQLFSFSFYDQDWQGGELKRMKDIQFLVFLAVWVLFPMFLGKLSVYLC